MRRILQLSPREAVRASPDYWTTWPPRVPVFVPSHWARRSNLKIEQTKTLEAPESSRRQQTQTQNPPLCPLATKATMAMTDAAGAQMVKFFVRDMRSSEFSDFLSNLHNMEHLLGKFSHLHSAKESCSSIEPAAHLPSRRNNICRRSSCFQESKLSASAVARPSVPRSIAEPTRVTACLSLVAFRMVPIIGKSCCIDDRACSEAHQPIRQLQTWHPFG